MLEENNYNIKLKKYAMDVSKEKTSIVWCVAKSKEEALIILSNWLCDNKRKYNGLEITNNLYVITKECDYAYKKSKFHNYRQYLNHLYNVERRAGYLAK